MRVLGIVTARGGSKGIPHKNLRPLGGKPLLGWTAEAAKGARHLSRVILSTESESIATVGRQYGLDVPFLRPVELAGDATPTLPVLQHAVRQLEAEGDRYDAICLLQPTTPLRTAEMIDGCIELLECSSADAVVTVLPVPAKFNPHWVFVVDQPTELSTEAPVLRIATGDSTIIPRRQELPAAYHREGSVYVTLRDVLLEDESLYGNRLVGFPVPPERSVNIDTLEDWARAEALIQERT